MVDYPALSGIDDASQVRLALVVNKEIAHVPLNTLMDVLGFQPLDADLTAIAALATTAYGRSLLTLADAAAGRTSFGLGSAATKELTSLVAYTPTFTGFGTVSGISAWSCRVGDSLEGYLKFISGTPTAVEARVTMGFNGTNANVSSDATKIPSIMLCGTGAFGIATASSLNVLIESNVGYITFGVQNATTVGMTKALGSGITTNGTTYSVKFKVPISGW